MSRVGVRTLLTWYKTKSIHKIEGPNFPYCHWTYSENLKVSLHENDYIISYHPSNRYYEVYLLQTFRRITLSYVENTQYHTLFFNPFSAHYDIPNFTDKLSQIPVTNIFTMFPTIMDVIQSATKNYTEKLLR